MKICRRESCYVRVEGRCNTQYCSDKCKRIVKSERDAARKLAKKLAGTPDDPMLGKKFDCVLSLEWLTRPLRAA